MLNPELREKLVEYVKDEITLRELEEWTVPRSRSFILYPNSADADVMAAIDLCLAEFSDGIRDEDSIKAYLIQVLQKYNMVYVDLPYPPLERTIALATGTVQMINYSYVLDKPAFSEAGWQSRGYTSP